MSQPIKLFQSAHEAAKSGNIKQLTVQVNYWQKLTKIIQPLLPQPEQWQVVCYQHGVLTITGENQAMISQLGYLQKQYVAQLSQISDFQDLTKINVRLRGKSKPQKQPQTAQPLPLETQQILHNAAEFIKDAQLSKAIKNLATPKK